jgi:hypothetical protein
MKKMLFVLLMAALLPACSTDNSSTVRYNVDANGCLVNASGYDWTAESAVDIGIQTVNFRWDCADYVSPISELSVDQSRVTLTFNGVGCLQLTAELIEVGWCTEGLAPIL